MQKPMTSAIIRAGIIPPETLALMNRWGMQFEVQEESGFTNASEFVNTIHDIVENGEQVQIRDTDLDILRQYLATQQSGRLHIQDDVTEEKANLPVFYCKTKLNEYVIPWQSESIRELIVSSTSYLKTEEGAKVRFLDVRELFFGDTKAFMVCVPTE